MILQLNAELKDSFFQILFGLKTFVSGHKTQNFVTQKGYKNDGIISIHSQNQEVPENPEKHASILHAQKFYQVHLANSTEHNCVVPVQFDLVDMYFYSR